MFTPNDIKALVRAAKAVVSDSGFTILTDRNEHDNQTVNNRLLFELQKAAEVFDDIV